MISIFGEYKRQNNKVLLVIDLDKETFNKMKEHIIQNMFFAYRRIAPMFKAILLNSIGDHIEANDRQNLDNAEVAIEVLIKDLPKKEEIFLLEKESCWYVCCMHETEVLTFSINKDDHMIKGRNYIDVG